MTRSPAGAGLHRLLSGLALFLLLAFALLFLGLAGADLVAALEVLAVGLRALDLQRLVLSVLGLVTDGEDRPRTGADPVAVPQVRRHGVPRNADCHVRVLLRPRAMTDRHLLRVLSGDGRRTRRGDGCADRRKGGEREGCKQSHER